MFKHKADFYDYNVCMYVCIYVCMYSQNTLTFNTLRHRQCKHSMCPEGQTGVKHLRLPTSYVWF